MEQTHPTKRKRENDDEEENIVPNSKRHPLDLSSTSDHNEVTPLSNNAENITHESRENRPICQDHTENFQRARDPQKRKNREEEASEAQGSQDFIQNADKKRKIIPSTTSAEKDKIILKQSRNPIFVRNIILSLRKAVIGKHFQKFAKFIPSKSSKTIILIIEGIPESIINNEAKHLGNVTNIFSSVDVLLDNISFAQEIRNIYQYSPRAFKNEDLYCSVFPEEKNVKVTLENEQSATKLQFLLQPLELMTEGYPLPINTVPFSQSENYDYTKEIYATVTKKSPLYALDCEIFTMRNRNEKDLKWMAVVNENHELMYEYKTNNAPRNREGNDVHLREVKNQLRNKLPSDAILCGQSLNFDLHILNLIHPFVIDTSVLYQTCENKHSLKELSVIQLGDEIQSTNKHNPIEDAVATMKLVQLKLNMSAAQKAHSLFLTNSQNSKSMESNERYPSGASKADTSSPLKSDAHHQNSLFTLIAKHSKRVAIIGKSEDIENYQQDFVPASVEKIIENDIRSAVTVTRNCLSNFDLVMTHLSYEHDQKFGLGGIIEDMCSFCPANTMVMVVLSPEADETQCFKKGLFMKKLK